MSCIIGVLHESIWIHRDRKSTRLNSSHLVISYAVFCLKKKKKSNASTPATPHYNLSNQSLYQPLGIRSNRTYINTGIHPQVVLKSGRSIRLEGHGTAP